MVCKGSNIGICRPACGQRHSTRLVALVARPESTNCRLWMVCLGTLATVMKASKAIPDCTRMHALSSLSHSLLMSVVVIAKKLTPYGNWFKCSANHFFNAFVAPKKPFRKRNAAAAWRTVRHKAKTRNKTP